MICEHGKDRSQEPCAVCSELETCDPKYHRRMKKIRDGDLVFQPTEVHTVRVRMKEHLTEAQQIKRELEKELLFAIKDKIAKFEMLHGVTPANIIVLTDEIHVLGKGKLYTISDVEVEFNMEIE
jgi:hypothetical protein